MTGKWQYTSIGSVSPASTTILKKARILSDEINIRSSTADQPQQRTSTQTSKNDKCTEINKNKYMVVSGVCFSTLKFVYILVNRARLQIISSN